MKKILFAVHGFERGTSIFTKFALAFSNQKSSIIESQHYIAFSDTDSQGNIYVGGRYGRFAFPSINSITFDNITKPAVQMKIQELLLQNLTRTKM